nr:hypothetical protein [Tanacetum cinerariifolium]
MLISSGKDEYYMVAAVNSLALNQGHGISYYFYSSNSSKESVGSHASRVILFGTIPAIFLVIPEVPIVPADPIVASKVGVISPTRMLDLVDYSSSSDFDPSEDFFPMAPELPLDLPFLCFDDSEAESESELADKRPKRHESLTPSSEFPLAPVVAPPEILSSLDLSSKRSLDSSLPSAGPSRKKCRSPATLVPSSTLVSRLIAPDLADLLPCKRFRDSYSSEDEDEFEAEAGEGGTMEIAVDPLATGDIYEPSGGDAPDLEGTIYDMFDYMSKRERAGLADRVRSLGRENLRVCRDRDDTQRRLKRLESLVERRFRFCRRTMTITCSGMTPEPIEELVNRRVEEALAAYEATRAANALEAESQSQNGSADDNRNGDNENGRNGNGDNGNGRNGNIKENDRGARPVARECTYRDFIKC